MRDIGDASMTFSPENIPRMSIRDAYIQALSTSPQPRGGVETPQLHLPQEGYGHTLYASVDMWTQALGHQPRRESHRGYVLEQCRRLRHLYGGLRYTTVHHLATGAAALPGSWARNLIGLLEQRLDMVLCRAWWCQGPRQARLYIRRGMIYVNGVVVYRSSYRLAPGDVVSIAPIYREALQRACIDMWNAQRVEPTSRVPRLPRTSGDTGGGGENASDILSRALQHGYCTPIPGTQLMLLTPQQSTRGDIATGAWHHLARRVCHGLLGDGFVEEMLWPRVCLETPQTSTAPMEGSPLYAHPHLEIHYSTMRLVYLYTPQCITWPCLVDLEALRPHVT